MPRKVKIQILPRHIKTLFPNYISEGNDRAEVEKNNSNDTLVCDDDAHIVVVCTRSPFV